MKAASKILLLLFALGATFTSALTPNTPFKHVIIVIQENRTPDNLFGSDAFTAPPQLPGADLATQGYCHKTLTNRTPWQLNACFDPDHGHSYVPPAPAHPDNAWVTMYDHGAMDGACDIYLSYNQKVCTPPPNAQYTYVDNSSLNVQPYFDIAKNYGYANYMFQTNQGPSFEAHQFLFSGTSAPTSSSDNTICGGNGVPCYKWFAAENQIASTYGCIADASSDVIEIDPGGNESTGIYNGGYPCYEHNTLSDLLEQNKITWKYYPQGKPATIANMLWTAPNAINHICQPGNGTAPGDVCLGPDWTNNVLPEIPPPTAQPDMMAPILEDIENCNLSGVSWVIPDGTWSDHAGAEQDQWKANFKGPAWVAAIVNAVGSTNPCPSGESYWNDTVILVTWDDWGGFYDHVLPWRCNTQGVCGGYPDGNNDTGQYIYGFRVPLLVVSAYNKHASGPAGFTGYISGACGQSGQPICPNEGLGLVHDFGSILNFTEWALGTGGELPRRDFAHLPLCRSLGAGRLPELPEGDLPILAVGFLRA